MVVNIEDLTFNAIIGKLPFERKNKQRVIVDLSFEYIYMDGEFIDYAKVVKLIKQIIRKERFYLLEEAVIILENELIQYFNMSNIKLKISKPDIIKNCVVSVSNSHIH
jgi:dihydroneopterin aldolase